MEGTASTTCLDSFVRSCQQNKTPKDRSPDLWAFPVLFPIAGMLFPTLAHELVIIHPPGLDLNVTSLCPLHLAELSATMESFLSSLFHSKPLVKDLSYLLCLCICLLTYHMPPPIEYYHLDIRYYLYLRLHPQLPAPHGSESR